MHGEPLLHIDGPSNLVSQMDAADTILIARISEVGPSTIKGNSFTQVTLIDKLDKTHTIDLIRVDRYSIEDAREMIPTGWQVWVLKSGPNKPPIPGDTATDHCLIQPYCAFVPAGQTFEATMGDNQYVIGPKPNIYLLVSGASVEELAATLPRLKGWDGISLPTTR